MFSLCCGAKGEEGDLDHINIVILSNEQDGSVMIITHNPAGISFPAGEGTRRSYPLIHAKADGKTARREGRQQQHTMLLTNAEGVGVRIGGITSINLKVGQRDKLVRDGVLEHIRLLFIALEEKVPHPLLPQGGEDVFERVVRGVRENVGARKVGRVVISQGIRERHGDKMVWRGRLESSYWRDSPRRYSSR